MFNEYVAKLKVAAGAETTSTILTNSLFVVVAGSNDITNTYFNNPIRRLHYDYSSYTDLLIYSASGFVQVRIQHKTTNFVTSETGHDIFYARDAILHSQSNTNCRSSFFFFFLLNDCRSSLHTCLIDFDFLNIKELYKLGARRIGVFGIPPIGCLPSQRTLQGGVQRQCAENYNELAQLFNV